MSPGKAEAVSFVNTLNDVFIFPLIALLGAVALLVFMYGCLEYVLGAENPQARDTGRKHIVWGIVGLLIIISAYTILSIVLNSLGLFGTLECAENANCAISVP